MTPETTEIENERKVNYPAWIAAGIGAGIGAAILAYRRRPRSRWDLVTDRTNDFVQTARKQVKPWMGAAAAGTAAVGTAVALYMAKPKQSPWQLASKRAGEMASRVGSHAGDRWVNVAATAAISLASLAYARQAQRRTIRGVDRNTADKINTLAEKGIQVLRRFREISGQTEKLYARGRRAMA